MKLTDKFKEPALKLLLKGKTEKQAQNSAACTVVLDLAGKAGFFQKVLMHLTFPQRNEPFSELKFEFL